MRVRTVVLISIVALGSACMKTAEKNLFNPDATLTQPDVVHSSYLKAHMNDGSLFVLTDWQANDTGQRVTGSGTRYDFDRNVVDAGQLELSIDSVALFETNDVRVSSSMVPLTVLTAGSIGVTVYCIANPKACFGSCPTFYDPDDPHGILAEGFSASIAPSLEDTDLDALPAIRPHGNIVRLQMRNEALETHVVRWADLIAVPRPADRRVYALVGAGFVEGGAPIAPDLCIAPEGNCLPAVTIVDRQERFSPADSSDLAAREQVEIEFRSPAAADNERLGLVLVSRQSLLPTYIFYQTLAFMGARATEWLAAFERQPAETRSEVLGLIARLGAIEVELLTVDGRWTRIGQVLETGPLASDTRVIPLPAYAAGPIRLRLTLTRGMWRIDQLGLVAFTPAAEPERLPPSTVLRDGEPDVQALHWLIDRDAQLSTLPGDAYELVYRLPDTRTCYEFFLESRGYYLEWMRNEWLAEENPLRAAQLFLDPSTALRVMAPEFKRIEPDMERVFWSSKYVSDR